MLTDLKYVTLLSSRLRNFKKVRNRLYNCSCPLCGDSKTHQKKARGYFYEQKGRMWYKCHKCGKAMTFQTFIKQFDVVMAQEYRNERLQSKYGVRRSVPKPEIKPMKDNTVERLKLSIGNSKVTDLLIPFDDAPENIKSYLRNRKLSEEVLHKYFYYTTGFKKFVNTLVKGKFSAASLKYDEERIVVLFFDEDGNITGFQGREVTASYAKYVTIKFDEDGSKVFGRDRIDKSKPVYVVEGPIDSLFVDNCAAACGGDLVSQTADEDFESVYVFDNEPRKKEITYKMEKAIAANKKVVIFPTNIRENDVNDMVSAGINVNRIFKENTVQGLAARMRFAVWRKR